MAYLRTVIVPALALTLIAHASAQDFAGLSRSSLERGSLFSLLERDYGFEISYADEEIDATLADPQVERLLALPHGIPLLRIRQIIYSTKGRPTLHVLGLYRGDRHTLCIRRYR